MLFIRPEYKKENENEKKQVYERGNYNRQIKKHKLTSKKFCGNNKKAGTMTMTTHHFSLLSIEMSSDKIYHPQ